MVSSISFQKCEHDRVSFEPGDGSIQCQCCGKILNNDPNWSKKTNCDEPEARGHRAVPHRSSS